MALDQNLFTLNFVRPSAGDPLDIDLVDPSGNLFYRRRRSRDGLFGVYDPVTDSLLASVASASNSKAKIVQLYNPDIKVELRYVGTLSFRWSFIWEEHTFEWKREQCYLIRKPDPPVLVAITKEPPGTIKSTLVQIMDYNLMRFDIDDRKGLEILLLTCLLSFQDDASPSPRPPASAANSSSAVPLAAAAPPDRPPAPPEKPKPAPEDQIAILQAKEAREPNEVVVGEIGELAAYAQTCINLIRDPSILYISIRSLSPTAVPKVVAVGDTTIRTIHREELLPEDLHQYVTFKEEHHPHTSNEPKRKKVIKLDDSEEKAHKKESSNPKMDAYKPPENLTITLSKIPMPELTPKAKNSASSHPTAPAPVSTNWLGRPKDPKKKKASSSTPSPQPQSSTRPSPSPASANSNSSGRMNIPSLHQQAPPKNGRPSPSPSPMSPHSRPSNSPPGPGPHHNSGHHGPGPGPGPMPYQPYRPSQGPPPPQWQQPPNPAAASPPNPNDVPTLTHLLSNAAINMLSNLTAKR